MPNEAPQSFANHSKTPTPLIVHTVLLIAIIAAGAAGLVLREQPLGPLFIAISAIATPVVLLIALFSTRFQLLCLQDRIIRLEMGVRLRMLLPQEQHGAIAKLTSPQLIALRFASDEELPSLTARVLDGSLRGAKAIKAEIKDWQPDVKRI